MMGTKAAVEGAATLMKTEFEMKDLGRTTFCLGLQIDHVENGILLHQTTYIRKILKRFGMQEAYPLSLQWLSGHWNRKKMSSALAKRRRRY